MPLGKFPMNPLYQQIPRGQGPMTVGKLQELILGQISAVCKEIEAEVVVVALPGINRICRRFRFDIHVSENAGLVASVSVFIFAQKSFDSVLRMIA